MTEVSRDFKGIWIPREIWLRNDLTCQEKALWAEIYSLYQRELGGCYASNEYLEAFCGVKERRLQEMIHNLKEKGLLIQVSFNGRTRVLKAIYPPEETEPCGADPHKNAGQRCGKVRVSGAEKRGSPNIYRTKEENKEQQQQQESENEVAVAVEEMQKYLGERVVKYGNHWSISSNILIYLCEEYGIMHVKANLIYTFKEQEKGVKAEINPSKKSKSKTIANPESYLKRACAENWACCPEKKE